MSKDILPYRILCLTTLRPTTQQSSFKNLDTYVELDIWDKRSKIIIFDFMVDDRRKSKDAIAFLFFVCGIKCPNFWGQVVRAACSIDDSRET